MFKYSTSNSSSKGDPSLTALTLPSFFFFDFPRLTQAIDNLEVSEMPEVSEALDYDRSEIAL